MAVIKGHLMSALPHSLCYGVNEPVVRGLGESFLPLVASLTYIDDGAVTTDLLMSALSPSLCYSENEFVVGGLVESGLNISGLLRRPWPLVERPVSL